MGENTQLSGSLGKLGSFQYVPFTFTTWYSTCKRPWPGGHPCWDMMGACGRAHAKDVGDGQRLVLITKQSHL